ncbi:hypothetical protein AAAC51_32880 [Priestia megaterium]
MIVLENSKMKVSIQEKGAEVVEVFHKEKTCSSCGVETPLIGDEYPRIVSNRRPIKNDQYTVDQREYSLPQHGFYVILLSA